MTVLWAESQNRHRRCLAYNRWYSQGVIDHLSRSEDDLRPVMNHGWGLPVEDAIMLQKELAGRVVRYDLFGAVNHVAGVDVAYGDDGETVIAAVAILETPSLKLIEVQTAVGNAQFPYVPGLFAFRELPTIMIALEKLLTTPQLIVCDGQGIAHPRRFGLASHLGVLYDIPTIGCAKSPLVGAFSDVPHERGCSTPIVDDGETVGAALRTQTGTRPLYVSIGHRTALETACDWIIRLSPRYRLPETTRSADHAVKMALKSL